MDDTMRLVTYCMFERLEVLILNYERFMNSENWFELDKYRSERDALPLVLASVLRLDTSVLNMAAPRPPGKVIIELDKDIV